MKSLMFLFIALSSSLVYATEPRHMISLGANGLGWSSAYERMDTKSSSPFKSVDYFLSNIALNYAYRLNDRFQIGAFYEGIHSEYKWKNRDGRTSPTEVEYNNYGIFVLYNFSDEIRDTYFAGYSFGIMNMEEENSHDFNDAEGKAPFELDDISSVHEAIFGKRFTLKQFKLENLSYAPTLRVYYKTHGKDFTDNGIQNGWGASIQPIRFDLFF